MGIVTGFFRRMPRRIPVARSQAAADARSLQMDMQVVPVGEEKFLAAQGAASDVLLAEAEEIIAGKVRLFGGPPSPLELVPSLPLVHWSYYENGREAVGLPAGQPDVKYIWEPARFNWAFKLGRAYQFTKDERCPESFWKYLGLFLDGNPPFVGPNWVSAQEAALRIIAFAFAGKVFASSQHTTPERLHRLAQAIADHARRIPPTIVYARSQNNNHLLSEAAGLYTAGILLPNLPDAVRWRRLGWKWFNHGLVDQFDPDGAYIQNSTNYHRLALQLGLWFNQVADHPLPAKSLDCLAAGTRWLLALVDPASGGAPNLGPNDGAYILPLSDDLADYRPVLQAAGLAFLGGAPFPPGPWDEMAAFLGITATAPASKVWMPAPGVENHPATIRLADSNSWAYLRTARFHDRPGHADQLHLDLWWNGVNLAQDAGTYLYNAPPPWDNSLMTAAVHNTLTLNETDQMQRAGRFLYLDWAQAVLVDHQESEDGSWKRLVARHDGYRRMGVLHQRAVTARTGDHWVIVDTILTTNLRLARRHAPFSLRLHWLLPDCPWEMTGSQLKFAFPGGSGFLTLEAQDGVRPGSLQVSLGRAGELVYGKGPLDATCGWASPTYGIKVPALAVICKAEGLPPLNLVSEWRFGVN